MCRAGGVESQYDYDELYKRGIVPINLVPKVPSIYYRRYAGIYVKRGTHIKTLEKKLGRKYNPKNKEDVRLLKIITKATPEARAKKAKWHQLPEVIARKKEYMKVRQQTPEFQARTKAYRQRPEYRAKKKAYSTTYYSRPEVRARASAYSKEYNQRPEVKARKKALSQTPKSRARKRFYNTKYAQKIKTGIST